MELRETMPIGKTSWHLVARHGDLVVRVHPGMQVGEDAVGELSLQAADALIELGIKDNLLILRVLSEPGEPEVPAVYVNAGTLARVSFQNNTFEINPQFASATACEDELFIRVGQAPGLNSPRSGAQADAPYVDRGSQTRVRLRQVLGAQLVGRARSVVYGWRTRRSLGYVALASAVVVGIVISLFLKSAFPVREDAESVDVASDITGGEQSSAEQSAPMQTEAETASEDRAGLVEPVVNTFGASTNESTNESTSERANESTKESIDGSTDPRGLASVELPRELVAVLESEQLPGELVVARALQSLTTLAVEYPNDSTVRSSLESLTERLAGEAMLSFDAGDAITAARRLEQASMTGVASEYVDRAMEYITAADTIGARAPIESSFNEKTATQRPAIEIPPLAAATTLPDENAVSITEEDADNVEDTPQLVSYGEDSPTLNTSPVNVTVPDIYPEVVLAEPVGAPEATLDFDLETETETETEFAAAVLESDSQDGLETEADALALTPGPEFEPPTLETEPAGERDALPDRNIQPPDRSPDAAPRPELYPMSQLTAIRRDAPEYPRTAPNGASGSVDLEFTLTPAGRVGDVEVLGDPPSYFSRSAKRVVRSWRFEPVLMDGKPVTVRTRVRLTFRG